MIYLLTREERPSKNSKKLKKVKIYLELKKIKFLGFLRSVSLFLDFIKALRFAKIDFKSFIVV